MARYKSGPTGRQSPNTGYGKSGADIGDYAQTPKADTKIVEPPALVVDSPPLESHVGGSHRTPDHAKQEGASRGHMVEHRNRPWDSSSSSPESVATTSGEDQASGGKKVTKAAMPWLTAAEAGRLPD